MSLSKREQIIQNVVTTLETVSGIKKPIHRVLPAYRDMANFASSQFPLCAVVGGLPKSVKPLERTGRTQGEAGIVSVVNIGVYIYFTLTPTVHTQIDEISQAVWAALGSDPRQNDVARSTLVECNPEISQATPYIAINMTCRVNYVHTTLTL